MEEIKKTWLEVKADTSDARKTADSNQTDKKAIDYSAVHDKTNDSTVNDTADTKGNYPDKTVTDNTIDDNSNSLADNNTDSSNSDISNKSNNTVDTNTAYTDTEDKPVRKLTNIEKYRQGLNKEEQRELARQAGIRSGEVRRERRTLGEHLKALLAAGDTQEEICLALIGAAKTGNYKAFNSIRDTIGEMPTQKQEVTASITAGDKALLDKVSKRLESQKCSSDTDETVTDNE